MHAFKLSSFAELNFAMPFFLLAENVISLLVVIYFYDASAFINNIEVIFLLRIWGLT